MSVDITLLPTGQTGFHRLRSQGRIYVDKTRMIYELAQSEDPVFLSRPRRFGKSLLVSTFESLFSTGLKDFKGLEIELLWKEKTYQVVRLDCSGISGKTLEEVAFVFEEKLYTALCRAGFNGKNESEKKLSLIGQMDEWLKSLIDQGKQVVLLVDEYDAPLTAQLNNPDMFEKVRNYLSRFYSNIKENAPAFRFIFITGIARFQKASIFSAMNTLDDITLETNYGSLLGYTQEELEKYFEPFLVHAAKTLKMSRRSLLDRMQEQYDGFCFDENAKYRLYAPWSVLKFLKRPASGFKNYWVDSGGAPSVLTEYFTSHALKNPEEFDKEQSLAKVELTDSSTIDAINPLALLTQAGYFTIDYPLGNKFFLRYPNGEVRDAMAKLYTDVLFRHKKVDLDKLDDVVRAIVEPNAQKLYDALNVVFLNIPHGNRNVITNEDSVRSHLIMFLLGKDIDVVAEKTNAEGRSDIVATYEDSAVVMELKFCKDKDQSPKENCEKLLKKAVDQIKKNQYGRELRGKRLLRLALVFSEKKRQFVACQLVD